MNNSTVKKPVMRYYGAKFRLAPWVMSFFPSHHTYVEPFGGAAGVFMQKPRSESEVYNDLDSDVCNVFKVLQNKDWSEQLKRLLILTPYARAEFENAYVETDNDIERARRTLIRASMGFGSASATKHISGFRIDSERKYGTAAHLWAEYPDLISKFCQRLQGVLIENRPALQILKNHDRDDTLFYVDPPYRFDTRAMGNHRQYYRFEMTDEDHESLLQTIKQLRGLVILSGYDSDQYNDHLYGWVKRTTTACISAGRGGASRTECIWMNSHCADHQLQQFLFR